MKSAVKSLEALHQARKITRRELDAGLDLRRFDRLAETSDAHASVLELARRRLNERDLDYWPIAILVCCRGEEPKTAHSLSRLRQALQLIAAERLAA